MASTQLEHFPSVWDHALEELGQQLGATEVERWFTDTEFRGIRHRAATISVPSNLHAQWIRDNHFAKLCEVLGVNECKLIIEEPAVSPIDDKEIETVSSSLQANSSSANIKKKPRNIPAELPEQLQLNRNYTFENFVVGPANQLAHAASLGVAEGQAKGFNPLFLHGSVGLGKTHLLQAVAHQRLKTSPDLRIVFLSCEQFTNHFIQALQQSDIDSFRKRYRNADILIVDDIQLLSNKVRTQEEFFHTFNELHNAGKQIVLASDSPPEEISSLQDRLLSRFKWGMVAEICPPEFETRMAILNSKADRDSLELPQDVAQFIAENIDNNVRELEGSLTRVQAMASLTSRRLDISLAKEVLCREVHSKSRSVRLDDIFKVVCRHYGTKVGDLQSKSRTQSIVLPRQIAMHFARHLVNNLSLKEIGGHFGGRDHSTVLNSLNKISSRQRVDSEFAITLSELERQIKQVVEE